MIIKTPNNLSIMLASLFCILRRVKVLLSKPYRSNKRGTLLWPIRRNAVTMHAQEHLESSDFNHRLLAIGPTRNFFEFLKSEAIDLRYDL